MKAKFLKKNLHIHSSKEVQGNICKSQSARKRSYSYLINGGGSSPIKTRNPEEDRQKSLSTESESKREKFLFLEEKEQSFWCFEESHFQSG
ncbi:hypothetical protein NPIL_670481 [Nephila pilipes]|uniref:Uncharacterized protein n=1 Tax=Nephila pilipes TaxID=299642 RepID=A0A8X6U069_NEPPI|nr:hypothetical protein NPIL_670481 [Nephila pilipes]